ncbi:MAG: DsbA family oxidoreductase, partial [Blastocatellia bacterium]
TRSLPLPGPYRMLTTVIWNMKLAERFLSEIRTSEWNARQDERNPLMTMTMQVFSDYVCPYCYLGEVPLKTAAAKTGAQVVWRAFQLRRSAPAELDPREERKSDGWRNSVYPMAARLGVEINRPSHAPMTRLAHEAAAWARSQDHFEAFHKHLFHAYFVEDKDIGELAVLKEIAWRAGLNSSELEQALNERRMAEDVDEDLLIAETYGVTVVPAFVIGGYLLQGVQEESTLVRAIELARDGKLDAEVKKLPHLPINIAKK